MKTKRLLLSLITLLVTTVSWADVAINETNFPDENFRSWVKSQSYGSDGVLTDAEIAGVTSIDVSGTYSSRGSISSLKGIEFFTALKYLNCYNNQLTTLDVSKNTALTVLYCYNNQLTTLDVSKNTALTGLYCNYNQLTALDVSNNTALTDLSCGINQLTALDVSKNTALTKLYCGNNSLTALDVSKNTALRYLDCYNNQLTALDVSKNTALTELYCGNNSLTALDVSKNTALTTLYCYGNQLTALDVSKNTALTTLYCHDNLLTALDVSKNTALKTLWCSSNQIKGAAMDALVASLPTISSGTMDVIFNKNEGNVITTTQVAAAKAKGWTPRYYDGSRWQEYAGSEPVTESIAINETNFPDENFRNWVLSQSYGSDGVLTDAEIAGVTSISIPSKSIKSLQGIEFFTALTDLSCGYNQLTALDVSKNTALTELYCYNNQLTALDVSKNTALTWIDCYGNQLTALDVSKNTALNTLVCYNNQLTVLDVSKNTALTYLGCYSNQLTALDVSGCTALTELHCDGNQLTTLDVSANTALTWLDCYNNQLTALDVSKNTALTGLYCFDNQLTALDVSKNTALTWLYCSGNQIKGTAMDALVESLPTVSSGAMYVIYNENEGNVMTTTQVAAAKVKGWTPQYYDGSSWQEYAGNVPEMPKCATPTINFADGKLQFTCETEGVEFVSKVTLKNSDAGEYEGASVPLTTAYTVTVYAKKDGYENSDVATKEINLSGMGYGKKGDVNGDGEVGMPDVMYIVNYILNGKFPEE